MTWRDVATRLGRHLVAALLELVDELLGEEALARRDDLGELDVGRARGARRRCAAGGRGRPSDVAAALAAGPDAPTARWPGRGGAPR